MKRQLDTKAHRGVGHQNSKVLYYAVVQGASWKWKEGPDIGPSCLENRFACHYRAGAKERNGNKGISKPVVVLKSGWDSELRLPTAQIVSIICFADR